MREFPVLVLTPISLISFVINNLAMVELLCVDFPQVLFDLYMPLAEHIGFGEILNHIVDAVVPVIRVTDHVRS